MYKDNVDIDDDHQIIEYIAGLLQEHNAGALGQSLLIEKIEMVVRESGRDVWFDPEED